MNTRSSVQLFSEQILKYFVEDKFPSWKEIQPFFVKDKINRLSGTETLSSDFLKELFKNDKELLDKIDLFNTKQSYLIIVLLRDVYFLECCLNCGYLYKKSPLRTKEN